MLAVWATEQAQDRAKRLYHRTDKWMGDAAKGITANVPDTVA